MKSKKFDKKSDQHASKMVPMTGRSYHGQIYPAPDQDKCLDAVQLYRLEQSFRAWSQASSRSDVRASRQRILLIFLIIRFTGAKLNEVLMLDLSQDIDFDEKSVSFGRMVEQTRRPQRKVQLSETLCNEIQDIIAAPFHNGQ